MGFFDIFGSSRKKAAEEERLAAEQKAQEHQRQVDEARKAHEGMPWPAIMKINLMRSKEEAQAAAAGTKEKQTVAAAEAEDTSMAASSAATAASTKAAADAASSGEAEKTAGAQAAAKSTESTDVPDVPVDPISGERKNEIGQLVFEPDLKPEDVHDLSLQELMFLMDTQILFQRKAPLPNYEQNHRVLYNDLLRRIHEADKLYMLFNRLTGYPLLDGPFGLVYLDKEHAQTAAKLYQKQYRQAVALERPGEAAPDLPDGKKQVALFDYLYYLGIENVLIDNGWYKAAIKRSEISAPPTSFVVSTDQKNTPPASPELSFAMIDFTNEATWPVKYDKRQQNLKAKMNRINTLIPAARYVIPVQEAAGADADKIKAAGGKNPIRMPLINVKARNRTTGTEEDRKFLPVFTDMFEYAKGFRQEGFRPAVFDFTNMMGILQGSRAEGFVINPRGASIVVPKAEALKMLQKVLEKQGISTTGAGSRTTTAGKSGNGQDTSRVFAQAAAGKGHPAQNGGAQVLQFPGTQPDKE